jgi:hypothetical protein
MTLLLLPAVVSRAQAPVLAASTEIAPRPPQLPPVQIKDVIHIVGFDDKPGGLGDFTIDKEAVTIRVHGHSTAIPLDSILAFSLVHGDKPLIHGVKGKLAEAAPYGVGFAVSMTRPSAETLSLLYRDSSNAIHGGVIVLPKDTEDRVIAALAVKLAPSDYPRMGNFVASGSPQEPQIQIAPASKRTKPDVEVTLPSESVDGIPFAVPAAVFESLIDQLTQSGRFAHVWRTGDSRITPDTLVLHLDMEMWKPGSARGRGLGPFAGATQIKSSVKVEDRSSRIVFQGKVDSAKRMKGESLDVAIGLAKHIRKALEKAPDL